MDQLPHMDYPALWQELCYDARRKVGEDAPELDAQQAEARALTHCFPHFVLACAGQETRQTRGTAWAWLKGRRAVELLVVEKYRWTPATARDMSDADIILALHKELSRFKLPDEALNACREDLKAAGLEDFIEHGQSHFFKDDDD